jgi:hypothetical protein
MKEVFSRHSANDPSPMSLALQVNPIPGLNHLKFLGSTSPFMRFLAFLICAPSFSVIGCINPFITNLMKHSIQSNTDFLHMKHHFFAEMVLNDTVENPNKKDVNTIKLRQEDYG